MPTEIELAWLAGLWEGEGSISIFRNERKNTTKLTLSLTLSNNDPDIILNALKVSEKIGVRFHILRYSRNKPNTADSYQLTSRKLDTAKLFLEHLIPYMKGQKRSIAELGIRFIDSRLKHLSVNRNYPNTDEEIQIFKSVKDKNKRGITKNSQILNDYTLNTQKVMI